MPIQDESFRVAASKGDLGEVALSLARLASNLHLALERIEAVTGADLGDVRREILNVNQLSFGIFSEMTGWEGPGWGSQKDD